MRFAATVTPKDSRMYCTSFGMLRAMRPSSMIRPVSTLGSSVNTDDTRMHSSTSAICFL